MIVQLYNNSFMASLTSSARSLRASRGVLVACMLASLLILNQVNSFVSADDDDEGAIDIQDLNLQSGDSGSADPAKQAETKTSAKDKVYLSPKVNPEDTYLFEHFDDKEQYQARWIPSANSKYEGKWELSSGDDRPSSDYQLVLPRKARHYAISSKLSPPFKFSDDKPLIVQYEIQHRNGQECGGAYVKLLRAAAIDDLTKVNDKTPFTIMFGPDKCGSDSKLHLIIQYLNPKTQEYEEKHWKDSKRIHNLHSTFSDKKHHLVKLVLHPSNDFEIFLDEESVGKGNLLKDMDPPVNPPKEIVDATDKKPADWDDSPMIDDPDAVKPDDWDEDAPAKIEDPNAVKPDDWMEDEPPYVHDPTAVKPADWEEMDGEWEAPLIENEKCKSVSGCGPWKRPTIPNPAYKGKWSPPKINNPKYKGVWKPRMIPNPDYYYDDSPFKSLEPIGGVTFELWSMADNIAFDNLIVTSNPETVEIVKFLTWQDKKDEADASSDSLLVRTLHYLKTNPWSWAAVVLGIALPLFIFITYCCDTKRSSRATRSEETARRKKTDESRPDDSALVEEDEEDQEEDGDEVEVEEVGDDEEEEVISGDKVSKKQVRQRKKN